MSARKQRLTVTVDTELFHAAQQAVESGEAESMSGWVSAAIEDKIRRDHKLRLLALAIADFETEFGVITAEEIAAQQRLDREQATVVRGRRLTAGPEAGPA
ncbi:MAG: YlcI/YnfO family protein [Acidimicrobiales bacterium]